MSKWLNQTEPWVIVDRLATIVLANATGAIVDIGIGSSTVVLAAFSKQFDRMHYSCDINERFCMWIKKRFDWINVFHGKSIDFIKQFVETDIAILFIDGEHRYETIQQEVAFFLPLLNKNGMIFLHDTLPGDERLANPNGRYCGTAYKMRQKLEKKSNLNTFTWPYTAHGYGLTMVMKKEIDPPYYRS